MPRNSKPRKPYRPRQSIYPDLHDVGLIFRPIFNLFEQLRAGEVDAVKGRPVFRDWQGQLCEVVPALEGWAGCWDRIAAGERLQLSTEAIKKMAKRLQYDVPLTEEEVDAAWQEVLVTQRLCLRIPRVTMGRYMRDEQISIEVDRLGLAA